MPEVLDAPPDIFSTPLDENAQEEDINHTIQTPLPVLEAKKNVEGNGKPKLNDIALIALAARTRDRRLLCLLSRK